MPPAPKSRVYTSTLHGVYGSQDELLQPYETGRIYITPERGASSCAVAAVVHSTMLPAKELGFKAELKGGASFAELNAALQVRHDVAPHAVDCPPIKLSDAQPPDKTIRRPLDQERETTR